MSSCPKSYKGNFKVAVLAGLAVVGGKAGVVARDFLLGRNAAGEFVCPVPGFASRARRLPARCARALWRRQRCRISGRAGFAGLWLGGCRAGSRIARAGPEPPKPGKARTAARSRLRAALCPNKWECLAVLAPGVA